MRRSACEPDARAQTTFQTEIGQLIDLITAPEDHVDLSKFSLAKYVLACPCSRAPALTTRAGTRRS